MLLVALALALAAPSPAGDGAPAAIASPQLLRAAEVAYADLRRMAALAAPDPALEGIRAQLSPVERELGRLRAAGVSGPVADALINDVDYYEQEISRRDSDARRWDDQIAARATELDAAAGSLRRLAETFRLTVDALGADAPPALVARAAEVRDRSARLEGLVRKRLASLLELQDRVVALRLALADLLAGVEATNAARRQELFEIESTPLWRAWGRSQPSISFGTTKALALQVRTAVLYLASEPWRSALHLALLLLLIGAGTAVTRRLRGLPPREGDGPTEVEVVRKLPFASATLLALFATPLVHPGAPAALTLLLYVVGLAPFFRLVAAVIPGWQRPLRWLAALFAVELLLALVPHLALFGRLVLFAASGLGCAGFVAGLRREGWLRIAGAGRWNGAIAAGGAIAALLLAISAVANLFGNVNLAHLLAAATLSTACGTAVVVIAMVVFTGAFRAALQLPWARGFRVVRDHEQLLVKQAGAILRAASFLAWCSWTLRAFGAGQSFRKAAEEALAVRLKVGALDVSLGDLVAFALTLWIAGWLSRALRFALDEAVLPSFQVSRGRAVAISTSARYAVVALGFAFAMLAAGMEITRFTVLAGTLGVGIGFGLQNVVNNFVSGLILLYEQPVQVGDLIELGQLSGEVQRIGVRSSTVRTFQGADVIVPNSNFISAEVVNWTRSDRNRRVDISVGVAYGSEPGRVEELLLATARAFPGIAALPEPQALLTGFGESALHFELRVWTPVESWVAIASGVRSAIHDALPQAGISIPFPQMDLWVRSVPAAGGKREAAAGIARVARPPLPRR